MTADDIRSQRFGARLLRGLSPEEVTAFLEDVADAFGDVQKANASLTARVKVLEDEIRARATRETPVREKETSASSHIEVLRAVALQEVEALLHGAQARAQALLDEAQALDAAMRHDAESVKARMQMEADDLAAAAAARAESLLTAAREQE